MDCTCYYFDDIIKIKDFDFNNTLLDENQMKIFSFMKFWKKLWLVLSLSVLCLIKWMGLLEAVIDPDI